MPLSVAQNRTRASQTRSPNCSTREKLQPLRRAHRWSAPAPLRYWHLASIDAPTVAAVWSLAFAWVAGVRLAAWVVALQALTVWAVYAGDRLLDARAVLHQRVYVRREYEKLRERHYFHWRHRRILVPMACIAACAASWIAARIVAWIVVRRMPIGVIERGSLLAAVVALYFLRVHAGRMRRMLRLHGLKELLVGLLFVAGCALPAASRAIAVPAVFFAALAWLNCSAIEIWEAENAPLDARRPAQPRFIALGLGFAGIFTAALLFPFAPRAAAMLAAGALSALLLAMLDRARERMTVVTVRALADLVLLTPLLLLAAASLRNMF